MTRTLSTPGHLFDYFHDEVRTAQSMVGPNLADDTTIYLANLLTDRARMDRPAPEADTLAALHASAAHAPPGKQASTYRELGDRSLYLLGFFHESLDRSRRQVAPSYYANMGSAAYDRCDQVLKRWFSDAFGPVFHELSRNFGACVGLLARVRTLGDPSDDDMALAYERWMTAAGDLPTDEVERGIVLPGPVSEA